MSSKKKARGRVIRRKDPPTRSPDGARPWGRLKNPDPAMHYVFANPSDELMGVEYYESLGYEQVKKTEGGVRSVVCDKTDMGSVVTTLHGQILVQIPLGDEDDPVEGTKAYLDAPGQRHIDEIERKIIKKGCPDGLRGFHGVELMNETERGKAVYLNG